MTPAALVVVLVTFLAAVAGCGGGEADSGETAGCEAALRFAEIKGDMDEVDARIANLRPALTRENLADQLDALSDEYRVAAGEYGALLLLVDAEPGNDDLPWRTLARSLELRREGILLASRVFGDVSNLRDTAQTAQIEGYERKTDVLNKQLESETRRAFGQLGFDERTDGRFDVDC
jgi:hypothetical protein